MKLQLGVRSPYGDEALPEGFPKQAAFLDLDRTGPGITYCNLVTGRGFGKSLIGAVHLAQEAFCNQPGRRFAWTEPTDKKVRKVFFTAWRKIMPKDSEWTGRGARQPHHLWKHFKKDQEVHCYVPQADGSEVVSVIDLVSRNVDNPARSEDIARGYEYAGVVHDEVAERINKRAVVNFSLTTRSPDALYHWVDYLSTPVANDYLDLIATCPESHTIRGTSMDNPYLPPDVIAEWKRILSDRHYRQEVLGECIAQSGAVWADWSDDVWPVGNRWDKPFDEKRGWWLSVDLGNRGYWGVWQSHNAPVDYGRNETIDVLHYEYVTDKGDARSMVERLKSDMRTPPSVICVGMDVNTTSEVAGDTAAAYLMAERWAGVEMRTPSGEDRIKMLQYHVASGRICNTAGRRMMCVARDLKTRMGADYHRGVLECLHRDAWPDERSARSNYFEKGKGSSLGKLEDARDGGILYPMICMHPPSMRRI